MSPASSPTGRSVLTVLMAMLAMGLAGAPSATAAIDTEQAKLTRSDGGPWDDAGFSVADDYGFSVAVDGDTAVVGAYTDDDVDQLPLIVDVGSAYVFTRAGTTWTEQAKLTASDAAFSDNFGISVAVDGDTVVVGAFGDNTAAGNVAGSAYVFTRAGTTWTEQAKLTASDAGAGDQFGASVALDGDTAVVGALGDNTTAGTDAGSAYVFTRSGTAWTEQAKLTASDAAAFDFFGASVAVDGDTAVVGAHLDDTAAGANAGSAYVFTRAGTTWTEQAKLTASDAAAGDEFGISVAVDGDTAVVGAYLDDTNNGPDGGSAYVFVDVAASGEADLLLTKADSRDPVTEGETFTYGLRVTNAGPDAATGVTLVDTLPPEVSFSSAIPGQGTCGHVAGVVTCELGTIQATVRVQVRINVTAETAGTATNTATVSANEADPTSPNQASAETTINAAPNGDPRTLTVVKHRTNGGMGNVASQPRGAIACGTDCTEVYGDGATVVLEAITRAGSTFAGWGDACAHAGLSPTCTLVMDADKTVTATFTVV